MNPFAPPPAESVRTRTPTAPPIYHPPHTAIPALQRPWPEAVAVRALDIVVSAAALLLGLPLMLCTALIIRLNTPGPALFRQQRVGRGGRPFTFYKFRTMYADARERFPELYRYQYSSEEVRTLCFKLKDDPRLTPVGRWLRRTTLDELPNFINVLRGEMSLVGPRPEIPEMMPYYTADQLRKFSVKPGATGLAQINGRGHLTLQQTIAFDLEYCDRRSLGLDLWVLLMTVRACLFGTGAF
jgi:lipopolysaccharide/colanic/teichoic acid biosynthesis glycosyltransferase